MSELIGATVYKDEWGRAIFAPTGPWRPEFGEYLSSGKYYGLELSVAKGFFTETLDFIGPWPIHLLVVGLLSHVRLEPIVTLGSTLEDLTLMVRDISQVPLKELPRLRRLFGAYRQFKSSLAGVTTLEHLSVERYPGVDLAGLPTGSPLRSLRINGASHLSSLKGAENWNKLLGLRLQGARGLTDDGQLGYVNARLLALGLEGARFDRLDSLTRFSQLAELGFSPFRRRVPALTPLSGLPRMRGFGLGALVENRDLSALADLPLLHRVRMADHKGYSPPLEGIQKAADRRAALLTAQQQLLLQIQIASDYDLSWLDREPQ